MPVARALVLSSVLVALGGCGGRSHSSSGRSDCPAGDRDGDCQASVDEGGSDCDDTDDSVFAGAPDNGPGATLSESPIVSWQDLRFPFCMTKDRRGALHFLGGDGTGFYLTNRSGTWETHTLGTDAPEGYCSLFVDDQGLFVVSSDGTYEPPMTFAHHPGLSDPDAPFLHETVTNDGGVVTYDIFRSSNGRTFVAYLSELGGVVVSERTDEGWVEERVADLPGWGGLSLAGSDDGQPWLLTNRMRDIYNEAFFSARSTESWTDQKLSEDATSWMALSLAKHHRGVPELVFQYSRHGNYGPPGRLSRIEYRTLRSSGFEGSVVDEEFWVDCMDVGSDRNGLTRVALLGHGDQAEGSARELRVYERQRDRWVRSQREELDHAPPLAFCFMDIDRSGAVTMVVADENDRVTQIGNRSPPDGIDQNCDGVDGIDADGDGIASFATGGIDDDE